MYFMFSKLIYAFPTGVVMFSNQDKSAKFATTKTTTKNTRQATMYDTMYKLLSRQMCRYLYE